MKILIFIIIATLFITGCSSGCIAISPPNINLTSEQTVIERQIIGDYKEIEKDAWVISSVKTSENRHNNKMTKIGDEKTFLAMQIRELHRKKIRKYKNSSVIGENFNGYISYLKNKEYENDLNKKSILLIILKEENKARKNIFIGTVRSIIHEKPSNDQLSLIGRKFAIQQREIAKDGDMIQLENGLWEKK